ncbi:hypothetical protein B0T19DRAFT_443243 [Cercophora scortea]|uniref:Uncharacterized protein n=1 Tax=Cercophora scortea TaxID=314031 RepID=A0AAE0IEW0_9PEZI|nr:hypothetical protein B0T19DRAFT_443243 [Cercophora scortea]
MSSQGNNNTSPFKGASLREPRSNNDDAAVNATNQWFQNQAALGFPPQIHHTRSHGDLRRQMDNLGLTPEEAEIIERNRERAVAMNAQPGQWLNPHAPPFNPEGLQIPQPSNSQVGRNNNPQGPPENRLVDVQPYYQPFPPAPASLMESRNRRPQLPAPHQPTTPAVATTVARSVTVPTQLLPQTDPRDYWQPDLETGMVPNVRQVQNDQWANREFRPSRMHDRYMERVQNPMGQPHSALSSRGGYRGNPDLAQNQSANIPDEENCSFFITNLPADITLGEFLDHIRNCGRIFASHLNQANPQEGLMHCAVKLVFFDLAGARRFLAQYTGPGRALMVGGRRAKIVRNRIKVAESRQEPSCSRVLVVAGPRHLVSLEILIKLFEQYCQFDIDSFYEVPNPSLLPWAPAEWRRLVLVFGSWRSQAEQARQAIISHYHEFPGVLTGWGYDPCDIEHPGVDPNNPPMTLVVPRQRPFQRYYQRNQRNQRNQQEQDHHQQGYQQQQDHQQHQQGYQQPHQQQGPQQHQQGYQQPQQLQAPQQQQLLLPPPQYPQQQPPYPGQQQPQPQQPGNTQQQHPSQRRSRRNLRRASSRE